MNRSASSHIPTPGWKFYLAVGILLYILFRILSTGPEADEQQSDATDLLQDTLQIAPEALDQDPDDPEQESDTIPPEADEPVSSDKEKVERDTIDVAEADEKPEEEKSPDSQDQEPEVAEESSPESEPRDYDPPDSVVSPNMPEIDPDAPLPSISQMIESSDPTNFHIDILEEEQDIETDESRSNSWLDVEKYSFTQSCYDQLAATGRFTLSEVETYCGCTLNDWKELSPDAPPKSGDINLGDINTVITQCMELIE